MLNYAHGINAGVNGVWYYFTAILKKGRINMGYYGSGRKNICGSKVREIRQEKGISIEYLATQLQLRGIDLSENSITRIENGDRHVTDKELMGFVAILKVGVGVLLSITA